MNDLDDFLNSIGLPSSETPSEEPQVRVIVPDPEPTTLSDEDYDNILSDIGFEGPPDADAEEITEEEESEEEEEDTNFDIQDATTSGNFEGFHAVAVPRFVGDNDLTQNGDFTIDPLTGETHILTENGIQTIVGDLDAEEDTDWQEAIDSGRVVPIPEDEITSLAVSTSGVESSSETSVEQPLIPVNSPTLLMDDTTSRFSGAEWYNEIQRQRVIIAGCGGIGSNVCLQVARMAPASMVLYDDDVVETVNMAGQLYCTNDVGKSKVDAIVDMITSYTSMRNIYALKQKFDESCEAGDIMICGFDNMSARKAFFGAWQFHVHSKPEEEKKKCLFLDGRLSIDTLQVFAMTGDDIANMRRYCDNFLFSDADADETVCSMKQTTYLACMIGSVMTNLFTNFVAGLLDPIIPYDLPFFTEYDAQHMIFKTEQ